MSRRLRKFRSGAIRSADRAKLDYEAFLSPAVLRRYAQYLHQHRRLADGQIRSGDNWQKGIPPAEWRKSLLRHVMDLWLMDRGQPGRMSRQSLLCAIIFNGMGLLFEDLRTAEKPTNPRTRKPIR